MHPNLKLLPLAHTLTDFSESLNNQTRGHESQNLEGNFEGVVLWKCLFMNFQPVELSLCHAITITFCHWKCGGIITTMSPELIIQKNMNQHNGHKGTSWWPSFPRGGIGGREFLLLSLQVRGLFACWAAQVSKGLPWDMAGLDLKGAGHWIALVILASHSYTADSSFWWGRAWIYFKVIVVLSLWQEAAVTSLAHYPPLSLDLSLGRSLGLLSD